MVDAACARPGRLETGPELSSAKTRAHHGAREARRRHELVTAQTQAERVCTDATNRIGRVDGRGRGC